MTVGTQSAQAATELSGADLDTVAAGANEQRYEVTKEEYERILAKKIAEAKAKS